MNRPPGPIPTIDQIKNHFEHLTPEMVVEVNILISRRLLMILETLREEYQKDEYLQILSDPSMHAELKNRLLN